jgi:hypothetical protein
VFDGLAAHVRPSRPMKTGAGIQVNRKCIQFDDRRAQKSDRLVGRASRIIRHFSETRFKKPLSAI